jgi:hypothetical protein
MPKVTRAIQYRYLHRQRAGLAPGTETLSEVLARGLRTRKNGDVIGEKARARIADLDQVGQLTLLNGLQGLDGNSMVAGELLLYRQGFDVPAISEDLDGEENRFELKLFKTDGKNKPVVGALYFAVLGDHVGVISSKVVTPRWLERYLTWLLKDKCELLDAEDVIELNASISIDGTLPSRNGAAKAIKIKAEAVDAEGKPRRVKKQDARGRGGTVLEVLALLGVGKDAIESLRRDVPEGANLEGDFQVYIKEGRSRKPLSADTLDHAFRNLDPEDVDIERKGSKARGKQLFLSEPARITEAPAGLDPNEAIEQILAQLYRWANNGTINLSHDP